MVIERGRAKALGCGRGPRTPHLLHDSAMDRYCLPVPDVMPILPSWDFDRTSTFYGLLGFLETGRWPDSYLILEHPDGIELHFFHSHQFDPASNDHAVYIRYAASTQVDALYERWRALELTDGSLHPPLDADYGLREFAVLDPMRNLLRVGGTLSD